MENIKLFIEQELIKQQEYNATILEISKCGSSVLRSNPELAKDKDFLVICNNYSQRQGKIWYNSDTEHYDFFVYDKKAYEEELKFNLNYNSNNGSHSVLYSVVFLYREKIYGDYNMTWNIFDYKNEYIEVIKKAVKPYGFNPEKVNGIPSGKVFVYPYIVLKIFESNDTTFTEEMRINVDKLYNNENTLEIANWIGIQLNLVPNFKIK